MRKTNYLFGIGTIGRDMVYAMTSMYLMYFLTDVKMLSVEGIAAITIIMTVLRIVDALNDPVMGVFIDNTKSRFGKFKPWIFGGAIASAVITSLLFTDFQVSETLYITIFAVLYLLWDISYTAHDIGYWSMLPALTKDQKKREKIGSIARMCADVGMFSIVVGIVPITETLTNTLGSEMQAYSLLAKIVSILMVVFIFIMLAVVKEDRNLEEKHEHTSVKEIVNIIFRNDQLLWVVVAMILFNIAYNTTISFGLYYFEYIYGDINTYTIFSVILGVSQLLALGVFPFLSQRIGRKKLYFIGTVLVVLGYIVFYFAQELMMVSIGGVLIFVGEGFIQMLMLMFITDCVEYGHYKLGKRNDSVTVSINPFVTKIGSAAAAAIVGFTVIITGIRQANGPADLSSSDVATFKTFMLLIPLVLIVI